MPELLDRAKEVFCQEYSANGFNAEGAARAAGIECKTAGKIGRGWLEDPQVQHRLSEILRPFIHEKNMTRERILNELIKLAFYDVRRMYDADGRMMDISKMDADTVAAIKGITTKGIHMVDKQAALTTLAKVWKILDADPDQNKGVTVNIVRYSEPATGEDLL